MYSFKLIYVVIFIVSLYETNGQLSDKRLCADPKCEEQLSIGKTLSRYLSSDHGKLSFSPNQNVIVYSKEAGSVNNLWGVEIEGRRGYVPKALIKETRILKKATILVDTEISEATPQVPLDEFDPKKVQEPYEVVDGTTIPAGDFIASSTESPAPVTASPSNEPTPEIVRSEEEPASSEDSAEIDLDDEEDDDEDDGDVEDDEEEEETAPVLDNEQIISESTTEPTAVNTENSETVSENEHINSDEIVNVTEPNEDVLKPNFISISDEIKEETVEMEEQTTLPPVTEVPLQIDDNLPIVDDVTPNPMENVVDTSEKIVEIEETVSEIEEIKQEDPIPSEIPQEIVENFVTTPSADEPITEDTQNEEIPSSEDIITSNEERNVSSETPIADLNADTLQNVEPKEETGFQSAFSMLNSFSQMNTASSEEKPVIDLPNDNLNNNLEAEIPISESNRVEQTENSENQVDIESNLSEPSIEAPILEIPEEIRQQSDILSDQTTISPEIPVESVSNAEEEIKAPTSDYEDTYTSDNSEASLETDENTSPGFFENLFSFFGSKSENEPEQSIEESKLEEVEHSHDSYFSHLDTKSDDSCTNEACTKPETDNSIDESPSLFDLDLIFSSNVLLYLVTTALSVILFLLGYTALDKSKHVSPLIARINKLEQQLLITMKENEVLQEKQSNGGYEMDAVPSEEVQELKQRLAEMQIAKSALEEQVQGLEKELDTSTEVGIELNRILSEILSSSNADDTLKANVEQLQRQLVEQQDTINTVNETLSLKETENHELLLELEISSKKVVDLQNELEKLVDKLLRIEEERNQQQSTLELEIVQFKSKYGEVIARENSLKEEVQLLSSKLKAAERLAEVKVKEYNVLKNTIKEVKSIKNDSNTLKSLLDSTAIKAELEQLKVDNKNFVEKLKQEQDSKELYRKQAQALAEDGQMLRNKFEEVDKEKLEVKTKLDVLNNYFKEKEAQMQKEISKYESMWAAKEGEATSTTERVKYMQEELQNYKAQNESLKQEIISQEVELKSQISVLEKKVHENWVTARQIERKLQDSQQESAQLRNRLTLRERAMNDKSQNRITSPLDQNGEMPLSPHPGDSPASPPLLYGGRDLITKSPPIPGLPPPFLPPLPGAPFMPLPMPPMFMPAPPPNMYPGDHRPPPLGRISSPTMSPRYSPDSSAFSPYDRHSPPTPPSPLYDSEFDMSPSVNYPYERREYKRMPPMRNNSRNPKASNNGSVGSDHSNESLKVNRKHPKV